MGSHRRQMNKPRNLQYIVYKSLKLQHVREKITYTLPTPNISLPQIVTDWETDLLLCRIKSISVIHVEVFEISRTQVRTQATIV